MSQNMNNEAHHETLTSKINCILEETIVIRSQLEPGPVEVNSPPRDSAISIDPPPSDPDHQAEDEEVDMNFEAKVYDHITEVLETAKSLASVAIQSDTVSVTGSVVSMSDATYAAIEKWIWSQEGPSMSGWAKIEMKMPVKSGSFGVYDKRKGYEVDNLHFLCNEIDALCETEITRPAAVSLLRSFIWRWDREMLSGKNGVLFDEVMEAIKQQQHGGGITAVSKNEASLLHIVALLNKVEFIGILLQRGAEIGVGAGKLGTPLHFAALSGGTEAVLFFLDQGANADATDSQGMTPFMKACEAGKETTAQILISRTTDVMLQAQVTLTMACKEGLTWVVQELLHRGFSLDQEQQHFNQTPIYHACLGGHVEILTLLLDYGATINSSKRPVENQLFVAAVDSGSKITIKLLIESDPAHFLFAKTSRRESALHIACKMGLSSVIVQWLVDAGVESDGVDIDGRSALHHAVLAGNDELMHILLNAKVEINIKDNLGLTALDLAVQRKNNTAIEYILDRMSTLDNNGKSTLHLVSAIDNVKVIEYILSRMYALNKNGKAGSTLATDIVFVDLDVGELLIQVPKDVYSKDSKLPVNGLNHKGESALHIATEKRLLPNVCLLLAYGADINIQNSETGDTPLHYAITSLWKEGIELLLEEGAAVNCKRKPYHPVAVFPMLTSVKVKKIKNYVASNHWKEGIRSLLRDGAYENSQTGDTPLHYAATRLWKGGIELLLEKGADVNIKNKKSGDTPLHYAAAGHWKEGIELLLEKGADRKIANAQGLLPRDIAVRSGKRISKLEPTAVSRILQRSNLFSEKDLHTGGSGQPGLTDKVKRSSKMRKAG